MSTNAWGSGYTYGHGNPDHGTMDEHSMPYDKAETARQKANEVMLALKDGKPGAADEMMGKRPINASDGLLPSITWMKSKFSGREKQKEASEKVVR